MNIEILRLGHRPARDKRITTHVGLTARALGAKAMTIAEPDASIEKGIRAVVDRFGGTFRVTSGAPWRAVVKAWKAQGGQVAHLTMYGLPLDDVAPRVVADGRDLLVVVGAEKVPTELYTLADHNVAVGSQPHSEVAALALFLDRMRAGAWTQDAFPGAKMVIEPTAHGKRAHAP